MSPGYLTQIGAAFLEVLVGKPFRPRGSWHTQPRDPGAVSQFVGSTPAGDFYRSRAWLVTRYKVLKRSHGRCECCGARASFLVILHVDHIKPRSRFPELALDESNLQVLCADCNLGKLAWDATDWRDQ